MKRALLTLALALAAPAAFAPAALAIEKPRDWQPPPVEQIPNFREDWRQVVMELASYAKGRKRDFLVLARGGVELVVKGARESQWEDLRDPSGRTFEKRLPEGTVFRPYMRALDGLVLDGLYCGPDAFGKPLAQAIKERQDLDRTLAEEKARGIQRPPVASPFGPFSIDPQEELRRAREVRRLAEREERQRRIVYALDAMRKEGRRVLSIENCKSQAEADAAYKSSDRDRVLSYAAVDAATLDVLPKGHPRAENSDPVATITTARNWLPLLRGDRFGTKAEWVMAMEGTNYDALLIDVTHRGADPLGKEDVARLKFKQLGSARLVLAVLPLGKAYDWRWYWRKGWEAGNPAFLFAPDADDPGSFVTLMSSPQWRELLGKYITGIVELGFDGVVLDDLDTYLWFEDLMPLDG